MGPEVPASLGWSRLIDDLLEWWVICCLCWSLDVMVDASESLLLTQITRSETVFCRLLNNSICCSILLFASWLDAARVAIIFIWLAMMDSNWFLMDQAKAADDVDAADVDAGRSQCWFIFDSKALMRASRWCSWRVETVFLEFVGELKLSCWWWWSSDRLMPPAVISK